MQNPRNLKVRKEAMRVAVETYRLAATFPSHELKFQSELASELGYPRASDTLGDALLVTKGMIAGLLASLRKRVLDDESRRRGR